MIEIRDAVKRFDGFAALDGVTLTVPTGAVYGLGGPVGEGARQLHPGRLVLFSSGQHAGHDEALPGPVPRVFYGAV